MNKDLFFSARRFLEKLSNPMVLDVATGKGGFLGKLLNELGDYQKVVGIEPFEEELDVARESFDDSRISFQLAKGESLPFDDDSFDLVTISDALHHVSNINKTLQEMKRVVKPEGIILIMEMYRDDIPPAAETFTMFHDLKVKTDKQKNLPHNYTFKKDEIKYFIRNAGINIQDISNFYLENDSFLSKDDLHARFEAMKEGLANEAEKEKVDLGAKKILASLERNGICKAPSLVVVGSK